MVFALLKTLASSTGPSRRYRLGLALAADLAEELGLACVAEGDYLQNRPAPRDYYYFVAQNDGSHYFSRTLDEHNRAVARHRKKRLSNRE